MRRARPLVWFVVYLLLVVGYTWPLAAHIGTHLPDTTFVSRFDLRLIVWALSWQTHALTTEPSRFFDANIFHPSPRALLYSEAGYGALPFFMPAMLATGNPVLAANVMLLASITLTAWGVHLLVAHATGTDSAGFVAAGALLSSLFLMRAWGPVAPNYAVLQWFPAIIALTVTRRLSSARALALVPLITLQAVVSPYIAAGLLATTGTLAGWRWLRLRDRGSARRLVGAVIVAAVLVACVYWPNAVLRSLDPEFTRRTYWVGFRAGPIAVPSTLFDSTSPTSIAYPLLALVGVGLLLRLARLGSPHGERLWRHGWLWTSVGVALAVRGGVIVGGHHIPMPYGPVLDLLPGMDLFRVPQRLGIGAFIGLAILAGIAFADATWRLAHRAGGWPRRKLRAALAAALVVASASPAMSPPVQGVRMGTPPLAPWGQFRIARARTDVSAARAALQDVRHPVLVLDYLTPHAGYGSAVSNAQEMLESIGHWYPLINGYGGYFPAEYFSRISRGSELPRRDALDELVRSAGLAYVFVRASAENPKAEAWWYLARHGGAGRIRLVAGSEQELLFAVAP